jgi:hypothetical protein
MNCAAENIDYSCLRNGYYYRIQLKEHYLKIGFPLIRD